MTYIKINNQLYPTLSIDGKIIDSEWNGRSSKAITLEMSSEQVKELFVDDLEWSIVIESEEPVTSHEQDSNGRPVPITRYETTSIEYDNSNYSVAGDIIEHRNGTVTVKMGTITHDEMLNLLLEGLDL